MNRKILVTDWTCTCPNDSLVGLIFSREEGEGEIGEGLYLIERNFFSGGGRGSIRVSKNDFYIQEYRKVKPSIHNDIKHKTYSVLIASPSIL